MHPTLSGPFCSPASLARSGKPSMQMLGDELSMLLISESYGPRTNMYSRQGKHPQRVNGIPPGTPDPPSRPSAPMQPAAARSYERSHVARPRSPTRPSRAACRTPSSAPQRARITSTRDRSTAPRTARATCARRSLPRAHMHKLTTRKRRARDALRARCGSLGSRWPVSKVAIA